MQPIALNARRPAANVPRANEIPPANNGSFFRLIILPDPRPPPAIPPRRNVRQRAHELPPVRNVHQHATIAARPAALIDRRPRNIVPNHAQRQPNPNRNRYEYPYVPPLGPVRNRHRTSLLNYNILRCIACRRVIQTNDLPALANHEVICSLNCFNRITN